jgi:N-acetylneuraminic acid mutarotase
MWADVGSLAFGWTEQTLTLMADGRVLMAGGGDGGISNNDVWIYDPVTTWESAPHLIQARQGHTATLLPDGRVLVAGGLSNGVFLRSTELYDPQTNQWSDAARLNTARAYHTATQLANGDVVIVGGASGPANIANAEIYHIATGRWEPAGITPPVSHHAAGLLPDGHVLAIGGLRSSLSAIRDCEISPPANQ